MLASSWKKLLLFKLFLFQKLWHRAQTNVVKRNVKKKRKICWFQIPLLIYTLLEVFAVSLVSDNALMAAEKLHSVKKCNKKNAEPGNILDILGCFGNWIYWKYPQLRPLSYNSIKLIRTKAIYLFLVLCWCCFSQLFFVLW